jgi:hypothetical protein
MVWKTTIIAKPTVAVDEVDRLGHAESHHILRVDV